MPAKFGIKMYISNLPANKNVMGLQQNLIYMGHLKMFEKSVVVEEEEEGVNALCFEEHQKQH